MTHTAPDPARKERISRELFVDAYTEKKQALCWYYYLENKINVPFQALWENKTVFRRGEIAGAIVSVVSRRGIGRYFSRISDRFRTN